ncbi:MAG: PIN domain-containing protein [Acidithiobacillus ferrooxidans]|jgi:hypothetical protein|uniref:PIN like domain-containing protein n=1 Tax=mine drainage metagenome TaxID=410659 RepID=E6QEU5_9ZZZZ|nr:PIN domain-containing protein [Acidithiobacillus thiooxidans]MDA8151211.1 PIN domain-containing protein [Acidithiobacillus sp.]
MKKTFPGHFPPEDKEIGRLWENCEIILDTNILLNLYRYSDSTRNDFIRVLRALKSRLWLPHQVAQEYFKNRLNVIAQQEKSYDDTLKNIQTLQRELSDARKHPFLSDKLMLKLTLVLGDVIKELEATKEAHASRTSSDPIQKVIGDLFNGRVGAPYPDGHLEEICNEGEARYEKKMPPGYKDNEKDGGKSSPSGVSRKYGDFIIWHQIINRAIETKNGVIFINDDKKEDWYLIFQGKTLGPRPELIEEFLSKTDQSFYMYQADRFLELAATHLEQKITPESMDEIREIRDLRKRDMDRNAALFLHREEETMVRDEMKFRKEEIALIARATITRERLDASRMRLQQLRDKLAQLQHAKIIFDKNQEQPGGEGYEALEKILEARRLAEIDDLEKELRLTYEESATIEHEYMSIQYMLTGLHKSTEQRFARG